LPGRIALAAGALALCLAVYLLRLDHVVGQAWDDAWYVLLAQALATGHGYTLVNSPVPGIVPSLYPPAFPGLLALAYRLLPAFPDNVWLLKSVSIAATLGVGLVTYRYLTRERALPVSLAFGIALATALSPVLVFLATSTVMSECVFTLTQLATIAVVEQGVRTERDSSASAWLVAGGALAAFSFLTRSISIALLVAVLLYLLQRRRWRGALVFTATVVLLVAPWVLYSRAHPTSPEQSYQGNIVRGYSSVFWQRIGGDSLSGTITAGELPARLWANTVDIVGSRLAIVLVPTTLDIFKQGNQVPPRQTSPISLALSALLAAGFVVAVRDRLTLAEIVVPLTLTATVVWPWDPTRFLAPLVPLLFFYVVTGCRIAGGLRGGAWEARAPRLVAGCLVGALLALTLYEHIAYIGRERSRPLAERSQWARRFAEHERMYEWIRDQLPADAILAAQNPAQVYLFTGRHTIASDRPIEHWETWTRLGVRYLARTSFTPLPPIDTADVTYRDVYLGHGELNLRVLDLGPVATRVPWGTTQRPTVTVAPGQ